MKFSEYDLSEEMNFPIFWNTDDFLVKTDYPELEEIILSNLAVSFVFFLGLVNHLEDKSFLSIIITLIFCFFVYCFNSVLFILLEIFHQMNSEEKKTPYYPVMILTIFVVNTFFYYGRT